MQTKHDASITRIKQGTVARFGSMRIGVLRIEDGAFLRADGTQAHGLTAAVSTFPLEHTFSVGAGSRIELGELHLDVIAVSTEPPPGELQLRSVAVARP